MDTPPPTAPHTTLDNITERVNRVLIYTPDQTPRWSFGFFAQQMALNTQHWGTSQLPTCDVKR